MHCSAHTVSLHCTGVALVDKLGAAQTLMVLSTPTLMIWLSRSLMATDLTLAACPCSMAMCLQLKGFQSITCRGTVGPASLALQSGDRCAMAAVRYGDARGDIRQSTMVIGLGVLLVVVVVVVGAGHLAVHARTRHKLVEHAPFEGMNPLRDFQQQQHLAAVSSKDRCASLSSFAQ